MITPVINRNLIQCVNKNQHGGAEKPASACPGQTLKLPAGFLEVITGGWRLEAILELGFRKGEKGI